MYSHGLTTIDIVAVISVVSRFYKLELIAQHPTSFEFSDFFFLIDWLPTKSTKPNLPFLTLTWQVFVWLKFELNIQIPIAPNYICNNLYQYIYCVTLFIGCTDTTLLFYSEDWCTNILILGPEILNHFSCPTLLENIWSIYRPPRKKKRKR